MSRIDVTKKGFVAGGTTVHVVVTDDDGSRTEHDLYIGATDRLRLCPDAAPELLARKTFEFLLSREPKEAILREFGVMEVDRYFPGSADEIARACQAEATGPEK